MMILCKVSAVLLIALYTVSVHSVRPNHQGEHGFQMSKYVKPGPDFKPLYKGRIITREQLNLSESAKLIKPIADYYEEGEGPEEDDDDFEEEEVASSSTTTTTTTTTTAAPKRTQKPPGHIVHKIKLGDDFKPLYKGKVINRYDLNLTDAARVVDPKPDYYEPGEGPEDDEMVDEEEEVVVVGGSSSTTSTTTTTTTTTEAPKRTQKPPGHIHHKITLGDDFKPLYKGKVINRYDLNLTDAARVVDPQPDYYEPGEGPEDDDEDIVETSSEAPKKAASTTTTTTTTTTTPATPKRTQKPPGHIHHKITLGDDFKPLYKGKVINRYDLNLTDAARVVDPQPDYYEPGEGPEDEDDDLDTVSDKEETPKETMASSTTTTTASPVESPVTTSATPRKKVYSMIEMYTVGPDFKPLYKGKVIPRYELNLTDAAHKISYEPDYYDEGEGPEDEEDELVEADREIPLEEKKPSSTSTTSTTTTTTRAPSHHPNEYAYDDEKPLEDIDLAVGGISGILQKIIQGPKKDELGENATPEEVYVHLSTIVRDESSKALKATIPRIYDYQYPIGNLVSQRCFNSFAQFGDRLRKGYVWPMKMITASSGLSANFALRDYGDFDRCLNILADDDERRPTEQFFTGQYCMMQLHLPLPALNRNISYMDEVLHFNDTELGGTFAQFVSENAPFLYSNPKSSGICVPSTCLPSEIEDVLHFFLKKFHIKVHFNVDCYSRVNLTVNHLPGDIVDMDVAKLLEDAETPPLLTRLGRLSSVQFWTIIYILASVVLVLLATFYEIRQIARSGGHCWSSTERNRPKSFFACFSARYNLEQVVHVKERHMYEMPAPANHNININVSSAESSDSDITPKDFIPSYGAGLNTAAVDGLKVLALVWACLANFYLLGYQPQMLPSVEHLRDVVMDAKHNPIFQLVTQSWLSMEIFFLLSGFLMAYTALPYIARHDGRPNLFFFVVKRVLRFTPSILALLLFITLLPLWKNAGPLYNSGIESILGPCRRFYWRDILFSSNFYKYEHTCLPHLWYISVEFQLSLLGIFVTIFVFNRAKHAWKAFFSLILLGVIASGYWAFVKRVSIASPIFEKAYLAEIPPILKEVYFSAPVHFSAYFAGLAIGYYGRMSSTSRCVPPKALRYLLWVLLPLLSLLALYLPQHWPFKATFKYGRTATALYYANFRLFFVATFAWALFECIHHRAHVIKSLLSCSLCRLLSQLSFQIYLINVMVISMYLFTKRTTIQPSAIDTLSVAGTLFVVTVVLALLTYLFFEAPYRALFRYYLESPRILTYMLPVVNANGGKPNGSGRLSFSKGSMLNLNPNFLFSPHYNLVTNISSRADSEVSSLANYSLGAPTITVGSADPPVSSPNVNANTVDNGAPRISKSVSSVSMVPNGDIEHDFNNNKNPGEAY